MARRGSVYEPGERAGLRGKFCGKKRGKKNDKGTNLPQSKQRSAREDPGKCASASNCTRLEEDSAKTGKEFKQLFGKRQPYRGGETERGHLKNTRGGNGLMAPNQT